MNYLLLGEKIRRFAKIDELLWTKKNIITKYSQLSVISSRKIITSDLPAQLRIQFVQRRKLISLLVIYFEKIKKNVVVEYS